MENNFGSNRTTGRGPWVPGREYKELRRPNTYAPPEGLAASNGNTPKMMNNPENERPAFFSTLSPEAKEFVPKLAMACPPPDEGTANNRVQQMHRVRPALNNRLLNWTATNSSHTMNMKAGDMSPGELAVHHVTSVVQALTLSPGRFEVLASPVLQYSEGWLGDTGVAECVVNTIVEQSIMEANFRYNGARLCCYLCDHSPEVKAAFRTPLLNKCRDEHLQLSYTLQHAPARARGFIMFLAELYVQLRLDNGARVQVVGRGLLEALEKLEETSHEPDDVKVLCQVLKLAGPALALQSASKLSVLVDRLLLRRGLPPGVAALTRSVAALRDSNWGRAIVEEQHAPQVARPKLDTCLQNEPVFYGPDGRILTAEESAFLQENTASSSDADEEEAIFGDDLFAPDDEMTDEIEAAYEDFLQMSLNKHNT